MLSPIGMGKITSKEEVGEPHYEISSRISMTVFHKFLSGYGFHLQKN